MNTFFMLLLQRLGYGGDPAFLCASEIPTWTKLFVTGCFAVLAASVILRSLLDIVHPQGVLQRVAGTRSATQWAMTGTAIVLMAALLEAVGESRRANSIQWLIAAAPANRQMAVTGLCAIAAGLLVAARAMVLMQVQMFHRPELAGAGAGAIRGSSVTLEGAAGSVLRRPGGGLPAILAGAVMAAYGYELMSQGGVCL